jgi:hypothetical protein
MSEDDIKIKLSPYLGCSKKLTELFAIIGYEEEALKKSYFNKSPNPEKLKLTFLSIVISDISYEFDCNYLIKQVFPKKPPIIKSTICPKSDNIIFFSCIDSLTGDKKIVNSGYALRFFERIKAQNGDIYFIPKAFLIYSQYPYFSSYRRICEKILLETDERYADREFPIEIFIHCLVNYFPSPINNNLILKDFVPYIIIPKLTGYPYVDFNLGKVLTSVNLNCFIKIYILIFLEFDLLFFSPDLEKLNIFMFALYILNYPLTNTNYFGYIRTISLKQSEEDEMNDILLQSGKIFSKRIQIAGNGSRNLSLTSEIKEGRKTCFKGVNCEYKPNIESKFKGLNLVVDIEDKKNPIINNPKSKQEKIININILLKYIDNTLNSKKNNFFLDKYLQKLHKNLNNILKDYNYIAKNDSNVANSFFYMNKSIMNINRQIQEIFYDFILNILVELNKERIINPFPKNEQNVNTNISAEEKIFKKMIEDSLKYNLYFNDFKKGFKTPDEINVSLLLSDEYVNLKKQGAFKDITQQVEYFGVMDKLYTLRSKDLTYDLKALVIEYSKNNYIPNTSKNGNNRNRNLFVLDEEIIKKFIYKKKNRNYYEVLKDPEEIKIDIETKRNLIFAIQDYFFNQQIINNEYYLRSSTSYLICICFPFFAKKIIRFVLLNEYLLNTKKILYFQRYYIFNILKAINIYYQINKEKGIFPEMEYISVNTYYLLIQNYINNNSINQDEELDSFFKKHLIQPEIYTNVQMNHENVFIYKLDNYIYEDDINKIKQNFKIKGNEVNIKIDDKKIKIQKVKSEDITVIFHEIYSYYKFFLSNDFDIKKIEVNKLLENCAKLIMLFMQLQNEENFIKILYSLMNSLLSFQKQLSDYSKGKKD